MRFDAAVLAKQKRYTFMSVINRFDAYGASCDVYKFPLERAPFAAKKRAFKNHYLKGKRQLHGCC